MVLSELYLPDQPVLVSTLEAPFTQRQAGIRLAIPPGYLKESQVTAAYPGSRLFLYESTKRALEALALDEVDAALGDVVSSNYLINTNYWVNLKIRSFAPSKAAASDFFSGPGTHGCGTISPGPYLSSPRSMATASCAVGAAAEASA